MAEITRDDIQELVHLNTYRKTESPMQAAHEALFRAKVVEFADGLIAAAIEREELSAKLVKTESCLQEAMAAMNAISKAVSTT
jgi:hypothetical protein